MQCLICYPATRLVAMLITVHLHLNAVPAFMVFGYALFQAAPLVFTPALAYRWQITVKATAAMRAERTAWNKLYPLGTKRERPKAQKAGWASGREQISFSAVTVYELFARCAIALKGGKGNGLGTQDSKRERKQQRMGPIHWEDFALHIIIAPALFVTNCLTESVAADGGAHTFCPTKTCYAALEKAKEAFLLEIFKNEEPS